LSLVILTLATASLRAGKAEVKTVEAAAETVRALADIPLKGIPRALLQDAAGVAIIPQVVKVGLIIDGRFGRGVILVHEPDGRWSNPIFVSLSGGGVGGVAGVEKTELVLVFKSKKSLDRTLGGKLTLGGDVTVAAGPIGREAEAASTGRLKAEIYSYSRSRGLFAGVSLEGTSLRVENHANEAFYGLRDGRPSEVLVFRGRLMASAEALKAQLFKLSAPPAPPVIVVPSSTPPPPLAGRPQ
jgi:lipid-binding SYLF domain-containing protein